MACPDPVKLIRRICALERTVTDLAGECEQIDRRRNAVAPEVIVTQQENIALAQEVRVKDSAVFLVYDEHSRMTCCALELTHTFPFIMNSFSWPSTSLLFYPIEPIPKSKGGFRFCLIGRPCLRKLTINRNTTCCQRKTPAKNEHLEATEVW